MYLTKYLSTVVRLEDVLEDVLHAEYQTNSSLCANRGHWKLPFSSYSNQFESELEGLDCSSESIASQLKEKHSVHCSDEEVDDPPQVDNNEDLSDDGQKEIPGEHNLVVVSKISRKGLMEQDLSKADLTQLHPLSSEVISRQATINIANSQVVALDVI